MALAIGIVCLNFSTRFGFQFSTYNIFKEPGHCSSFYVRNIYSQSNRQHMEEAHTLITDTQGLKKI